MKFNFSSLTYLVGEGFKNLVRNRLMSVASVVILTACLFLTGCAVLLSMNLDHSLHTLQQQNEVVVVLSDGQSQDSITAITSQIASLSNIKSARFVSKEDALSEYEKKLDDKGAILGDLSGDQNPIPDTFIISFKDLNSYSNTVYQLQQIQGVSYVLDSPSFTGSMQSLRNMISAFGISVVVLLFVISLFIISNTIKITMYNRRKEINIMKYVGATNLFIRFPFVMEGLVIGLGAGLLSFCAIWYIYDSICEWLQSLSFFTSVFSGTLSFHSVSPLFLIGLCLGGAFIGSVGSTISISRHLKV